MRYVFDRKSQVIRWAPYNIPAWLTTPKVDIMADECEQNRLSACSSIWYVLATVEGEPRSVQDLNTVVAKNRHYWNGLMAPRIAVYGGSIESSLGHKINLPILTDADHVKIREALNTRGFAGMSVPHVNSPIDFSNIEFSKFTSFKGFVFGGAAKFDNTKFSGRVLTFLDATFAGNVTFDGCRFAHDVFFIKANFASSASFNNVEFAATSSFASCRFLATTTFADATFLGDTYFNKVEFAGEAHFVNTTFARQADFQFATFTRPTHSQRTKFETDVPAFFEATLFEYTDWHDTKWASIPRYKDEARKHVQYYQRLVLLMNKLEKPYDRHFFFRKEMRAQRRSDPFFLTRALNLLYELVCDYGNGLGRIVAIWAAHILIGAATIWVAKLFTTSPDPVSKKAIPELLRDFFQATGISFSNAHALLGLNRGFLVDTLGSWSDVPFFNTVGSIQTVIGVIILFFLILTIRNRFRMR